MIDNALVNLVETQIALRAWFPVEAHRDRPLPGGGNWYYVPWQAIRDRLDTACPDWEVSYSSPEYLGDYCTVLCTLRISGVSRQAIGNARIMELSSSGKDMSRGTPIERATADAFKNAAEAWGVGRYLDEQADPKTKAEFAKYMASKGRGDAAVKLKNSQSAELTAIDRLDFVKKLTGLAGTEIKQVREQLKLPSAEDLSIEQCDQVRDECFVSWAIKVAPEAWGDKNETRLALANQKGKGVVSTSDLWASWSAIVFSKAVN